MSAPQSPSLAALVQIHISRDNIPSNATRVYSNLFTVYIFDMRKMNRSLNVLKDHVAAVMDVVRTEGAKAYLFETGSGEVALKTCLWSR